MSDLTSLLERVEKATGPDRELDALVVATLLAPPGAHVKQSLINGNWCIYDDTDRRGRERQWEGGPKHRRLGWCGHWEVTASIDAALALVREKLPGCQWTLETDACWLRVLSAEDVDEYQAGFNCRGGEATALSICAALIRALIAQSKEQAHG